MRCQQRQTNLALAGLLFHRGQEDFRWLTRPAHDPDDRVVPLPLTVRVPDSAGNLGNLVELPEPASCRGH
jgi:hypothetical protein